MFEKPRFILCFKFSSACTDLLFVYFASTLVMAVSSADKLLDSEISVKSEIVIFSYNSLIIL